MNIKTTLPCLALFVAASVGTPATARADEGAVPRGIPRLDHVFVIMMENHGYSQVLGNPSAPFMNLYASRVNLATNYYAVAHPSLTNYLEVVGGSNFGVLNDNSPDWHNGTCQNQLAQGTPEYDNGGPPVCPIGGTGTDAATPVFDTFNETSPPAITSVTEIDGVMSIPAAADTAGKTIADQLVAAGGTWKSYQEDLSPSGANLVDFGDGFYDNNSNLSTLLPGTSFTSGSIMHLYAVKHNPFAYFVSVQEGGVSPIGLNNIVGFEGAHGLFDDLEAGRLPNYAFVAPNQCNDQHGWSGGTLACASDPNDNGTLNGLNPGLIYQGDATLRSLVRAIHDSPAWVLGHNAIVIVWDENDYSATPNKNQVVLTVDTNYGRHGVQSDVFYTHFSLLKSVEAGLGLPCLNHACDSSTAAMTDLFAGR
jgi:phosphatidylinositol-3-phosphatase